MMAPSYIVGRYLNSKGGQSTLAYVRTLDSHQAALKIVRISSKECTVPQSSRDTQFMSDYWVPSTECVRFVSGRPSERQFGNQ